MDIITAHKFCSYHRESILKSKNCGCFYCLENFSPSDIVDWHDYKDGEEQTAFCPKCRIDSVIGDFDLKFDERFLKEMQKYWFLE